MSSERLLICGIGWFICVSMGAILGFMTKTPVTQIDNAALKLIFIAIMFNIGWYAVSHGAIYDLLHNDDEQDEEDYY